ncbi:ankyrin repeat domain-containing protein 62-like [Dunckerocampus dactyliophorus]|uniref:ankyrin repeat domain-containing protein 62-like n=1 Tax=Dunckerocampus dactyliophorus TaxID=161453 RepID=UPI00240624BB|nr:ankyrin repeat domain-containing protein 62-like [Dunckerocampus dactyliophorus]
MKKLFGGLKTKRSHEAKEIEKLHKAAWEGDMSKLKEFAKLIDINEVDKQNRTALHLACASGMVEVVKFLVENRAKLNVVDNLNRSPLIKAVEGQNEDIVEFLLENNADPNLMDVKGNTALHLASSIPSISIVLMLVKHNADINAQNQEGLSPLTVAAQEDNIDVADFLLKKGADVNILDDNKRSPLMVAASHGHSDMVQLLLPFQEDTTQKEKKEQSPEHYDYCVLLAKHGTQRRQLGSSLSHIRKRTSKSGTGMFTAFTYDGNVNNRVNAGNFSSEWIEESKRRLFEMCTTTIRCIRNEAPQKDTNKVEDYLKALNKDCGEKIPRFVSHHLDELPPDGFGNMDASALLSRMEQLNREVSSLRAAMKIQASVNENLGATTAAMNRRVTAIESLRSSPEQTGGTTAATQAEAPVAPESQPLGKSEEALPMSTGEAPLRKSILEVPPSIIVESIGRGEELHPKSWMMTGGFALHIGEVTFILDVGYSSPSAT